MYFNAIMVVSGLVVMVALASNDVLPVLRKRLTSLGLVFLMKANSYRVRVVWEGEHSDNGPTS